LFQILREDFLSFLVRACWLVSFFFTPIYMFILSFVVLFGPKKGVFTTYLNFWIFNPILNLNLLLNYFNKLNTFTLINFNSLINYQFTIFTSRFTVYVLFFFWCFFYFFGEILLLILFNFNTLTDTISSDFFFLLKNHTIFYLNSNSTFLNFTIMFYILFFTSCSFLFLLNLRYNFNYLHLNLVVFFDFLFLFITAYLFNFFSFFIILIFFLFFYFKK
jgi:hypothetical protein